MTLRGSLVLTTLLALVACEKATKISTGSVSGKALYAGQANHAGISVTVAGFSTTTDAAGSYSFAEVPVGNHAVVAVAPRSAERTLSASVSVQGSVTVPDFVFSPAQTLAGQLTFMGSPAAGATAMLDGGASVTTDASGVYSFPDATPGVHDLSFTYAGAAGDSIPNVRYSYETGPSVESFYNHVLWALDPFDLQGATRVASIDTVTEGAFWLNIYPTLSPNGQLYAYGLYNQFGNTDLYVGSTAGGEPVLVANDADQYVRASWDSWSASPYTRFSPDSGYLTFIRWNQNSGMSELWAAAVGAGPTVGAPVFIRALQSAVVWWWWQNPLPYFEFSPSGASPASVYFATYSGGTPNVLTLYEHSLVNGAAINGPAANPWAGFQWARVSKKTKRIVFFLTGSNGTSYRLVSAPCTGQQVTDGSLAVYEQPGGANTFGLATSWPFFSPDETRFSYNISSATVGSPTVLGFKVAQTGSSSKALISGDLSANCVSIDPTNARVTWDNGASIQTRVTDASALAVALTTVGRYGGCPTFSADGTKIWYAYNNGTANQITLANSDGTSPTTVATATDFLSIYFGRNAAYWTRGTGNNIDYWARSLTGANPTLPFDNTTSGGGMGEPPPSGNCNLYIKRELTYGYSSPSTLYWVGFPGGNVAHAEVTKRFQDMIGADNVATPEQEKGIVLSDDEGGYQTAMGADCATGATKPLLRRTEYVNVQLVGTPAAPKAIFFRGSSPMPWEFQNGIYVANP